MIDLYNFMTAMFVIYIAYIWIQYGVLDSISRSYYELPKKLKPLFTLALLSFAIPAVIISVETSSLMFFAGAGIVFVAGAAAYQEKVTKIVHFIGAGIGILFSQLAIIISYHMWEVSAAFAISSIMLILFRHKINNTHIWWIEILAFAAIDIVLRLSI